MKLTPLFSDFLSIIFPPQCHVCGRLLPRERSFLCSSCKDDLPLAAYNPESNPMTEALMQIREGGIGTAFMRYGVGNSCSVLIHDFKYRGFSRLARWLGKEAATRLQPTGFFNNQELILPIPLYRSKLRKRGYNQAMEIAKGISDATGIAIGDNLRAIRSHPTQTRLSHSARMDNVEGIFEVRNPERLEGRNLLLVDDVFTTGATLLSAARAVAASCRAVKINIFAIATAHR